MGEEATYRCGVCWASSDQVRLYRAGGEFFREARVRCRAHFPEGGEGYYVPLVVEPGSDEPWQVTCIPRDQFEAWESLPDALALGVSAGRGEERAK